MELGFVVTEIAAQNAATETEIAAAAVANTAVVTSEA